MSTKGAVESGLGLLTRFLSRLVVDAAREKAAQTTGGGGGGCVCYSVCGTLTGGEGGTGDTERGSNKN